MSWFASPRASADLLVETYREGRPADADRILASVRDELVRGGVEVRPSAIGNASELFPLLGTIDPSIVPGYPVDAAAQVELGASQVLHADYEVGIATLDAVLRSARANPARVVVDPTAPKWLTKAYAAVAFALLRTAHTGAAVDAIAEQIRSLPDTPIGRLLGPEVATLAESVRKTLDGSPRGGFRITISRPDVQVFINERPRNGSMGSMFPGEYRVLLARAGVTRRYRVTVTPGRQAELEVDWDSDAAFNISARWAGFNWSRGQDDRTDTAVARYARAGRQHDLYVVGIMVQGNRRFVTGAFFEKHTGARLRHSAIALGRDDERCGRALAQYLLKGDLSPCLVDEPNSPTETRDTPAPSIAANLSTPRVNAPPPEVAPTEAVTSTPSQPSIELMRRDVSDEPSSRALPIGLFTGGVALTVTGGVLIAINEDPKPDKPQRIFQTTTKGIIVGSAGVLASAGGAYLLWIRKPDASSTPVAVITSDLAYLGWLGRF